MPPNIHFTPPFFPPFFSSPFQLPALILSIFPTYLEEHPLSKCIYDAFVKFIFDKFTVPTAIQQDFPKWSRHIISNSFRIPTPASVIHPSREFVCEPPAAIASLLLAKGEPKQNPTVLPQLLLSTNALSVDFDTVNNIAFLPFLPATFPSEVDYLCPMVGEDVVHLFPANALQDWTVLNIVTQPFPPSFLVDLLSHCNKTQHCVLLSRPAFSRVDNRTYRQIGRMYIEEKDSPYLTITWQAGRNNTGTVQMPCHSVQYMFQTAKEPDSGEICVASPVGAYDSLLFVEHPLYLPRWVDGYFQQLDLTSELIAPHIGPILEDVQVEELHINLQETTGPENTNQAAHVQQTLPAKKQSQKKVIKPARSVQALVTDSKAGKAEVGSRRSNTGKKLKCDIEGISCDVLPTFARLGATIPTRCVAHKMPDMVAKQPDPKLHTHSAAASKAADQPLKKTAAKQVTFHDESDREVEILHTKQVEVDVTAVGKTVGDLYGQPQTSPAKQDICREKNCRKKATFTIETEEDDSIGVLCEEHANGLPGTYKVKGVLM